jgi:hypothetical protein
MVTGAAFRPAAIFFGRLVVWGRGSVCGSGDGPVSGDFRVLLWPVVRLVAGCFFFFGGFSASVLSSSAVEASVSGDLRVLRWALVRVVAFCFFFFGGFSASVLSSSAEGSSVSGDLRVCLLCGAAWQGRMVGGMYRPVAKVECKLVM